MAQEIRLTPQTQQVLKAMIEGAARRLSGADIARETGLVSGSLYPILFRLEKAGWLDSEWEPGDPAALGRPRKRLYRISAEGQRQAHQIARSLSPLNGGLSWV